MHFEKGEWMKRKTRNSEETRKQVDDDVNDESI